MISISAYRPRKRRSRARRTTDPYTSEFRRLLDRGYSPQTAEAVLNERAKELSTAIDAVCCAKK